MLRTIIAKEIRANILSFRFLVSFALLFVIVTFTSLVLTGDYLRRQDEYSQQQAELETYLKNYATSTGSAPSSSRPSRPSPLRPSSGASPPKSTSSNSTTTPCPSSFPSST
jgi:hypothetical protein